MSGPLPSIFDIPELFDMVMSQLSTQDLARCILVNKKWCRAALPRLWHTFPDELSFNQGRAFQRMVQEDYLQEVECQSLRPTPDNLKSGLNHVHQDPACQPYLSKYCPLIRNLSNPYFHFDLNGIAKENVLLSHFLKKCINVRVLTLQVNFVLCYYYHRQYKLVVDSLAPNLRELSLLGSRDSGSPDGMSSRWYLYVISQCSSKLEKLTVHNDADGDFVDDIKSVKFPFAETKLSGLKELVLDHCWIKEELLSWDWFWRSCGNVEKLTLRSWHPDLTQDLANRIKSHLPKVNSISFKCDTTDKDIAPLLAACANRK